MRSERAAERAEWEGERLLSPLGNRWRHTEAVAATARRLRGERAAESV